MEEKDMHTSKVPHLEVSIALRLLQLYPRGMCQKMKPDIVHFLQQRGLMQIPTWPKDLIYHTISHYYECIRCQLGRMSS